MRSSVVDIEDYEFSERYDGEPFEHTNDCVLIDKTDDVRQLINRLKSFHKKNVHLPFECECRVITKPLQNGIKLPRGKGHVCLENLILSSDAWVQDELLSQFGLWDDYSDFCPSIMDEGLIPLGDGRIAKPTIPYTRWPIPVSNTKNYIIGSIREWVEEIDKIKQQKLADLLDANIEWQQFLDEMQTRLGYWESYDYDFYFSSDIKGLMVELAQRGLPTTPSTAIFAYMKIFKMEGRKQVLPSRGLLVTSLIIANAVDLPKRKILPPYGVSVEIKKEFKRENLLGEIDDWPRIAGIINTFLRQEHEKEIFECLNQKHNGQIHHSTKGNSTWITKDLWEEAGVIASAHAEWWGKRSLISLPASDLRYANGRNTKDTLASEIKKYASDGNYSYEKLLEEAFRIAKGDDKGISPGKKTRTKNALNARLRRRGLPVGNDND
jgi:hypothetical protein